MKELLKHVFSQWDNNGHSPLHVASFKGDFKSSRLFTSLGADPQSADNSVDPLKVAKDKYTRDVL
jgi:ankyrin repeat protein